MTSPVVPIRTEKPERDPDREWQKSIPPWALLALLSLSTTGVGWLVGRLDKAQDKQLAQLETATKNARDVYVAGLSERLATVEADVRVLKESTQQTNSSMNKVIYEIKALAVTNERLSTKVESLTSEISRMK